MRIVAGVAGADLSASGFSGDVLERIVAVITANRTLWAKTMAVEEYGLSPTPRSPIFAALSTFTAFVVCGFIPLISYLSAGGLAACVIAAGATFFYVGAIKSRWSPVAWWRSALETTAIGMSAAAVAFVIGLALKDIFHVPTV